MKMQRLNGSSSLASILFSLVLFAALAQSAAAAITRTKTIIRTTTKTTTHAPLTKTITSTTTGISVTTSTTTKTSTTVSVDVLTCPTLTVTPDNPTYVYYHFGQYKTLNPNNPGNNANNGAVVNYIDRRYALCDALYQCALDATNDAPPHSYLSFQVIDNGSNWICTQYYNRNTDESYFNVPDASAVRVYGYSAQ